MLNDIVVELLEKKEKIQLGNNEKIEKQHQKGKLTARERIYVY
jgi:acetyl-CoA carboxylase carboxyltransferase component